MFGSYGSPGSQAQLYDGSSWSNTASMSSLKENTFSGGTQAAAIASSGGPSASPPTATEEFSGPGTTIETVTTS